MQSIRATFHNPPVEVSGLSLFELSDPQCAPDIEKMLKNIGNSRRPWLLDVPDRFSEILTGKIRFLPYGNNMILSLMRRAKREGKWEEKD